MKRAVITPPIRSPPPTAPITIPIVLTDVGGLFTFTPAARLGILVGVLVIDGVPVPVREIDTLGIRFVVCVAE
jgi:hypothetical protein